MDTARTQAIARLLNPRAIAVVGASADFAKVSGRPIKHLMDKGYGGAILPVNPKHENIAGLACYPDIASLPDGVDLAIVAVPAQAVSACVVALGARGIPAAVVFSAGFGETGESGRALAQALAASAKRAGVVLLGPNCLGFINAFDQVYATFSQAADGPALAGPIAFVSQSGAFGTAIAALARARGLGLGYFVNTGNEAVLNFADVASVVARDARVRVVAGYLEGVADGAGLIALAQTCHELGKPLVLTKVGRTAAGARAAASHTGALAGEDAVFDAVMRQFGVLRARNEEQLLDMIEALLSPRACNGTGLGIVTQSGGAGVMMADRAEELGLCVPRLADHTQQGLAKNLPDFGALANPVDVTGQFVAAPEMLREAVTAVLDDAQVHVAIVWLQLMENRVDALVQIFQEIVQRTHKPFLVCWVAAPQTACVRLRQLGIPVFGAGERAVEAAAALARFYRYRAHKRVVPAPLFVPLTAGLEHTHQGVVSGEHAVAWLRAAGIPMAPVTLARDADAAVAAWRAFGQAVALKIESPDITHKTEVGGVQLACHDEATVRSGFAAVLENAARHAPDARIAGVLVQPMTEGHVELVMGVHRDPVFGVIVMVGTGGVWVEVLHDVVFRRAPFDAAEGMAMLQELHLRALLAGVRGQPAVDQETVARMLSDLSRWAAAVPNLRELDINPVRAGSSGVVGVDCVMIFGEAAA